MHLFHNRSKAVAQITCEGRNGCQPSVASSTNYLRTRSLLFSQRRVRLLIHKDTVETGPLYLWSQANRDGAGIRC